MSQENEAPTLEYGADEIDVAACWLLERLGEPGAVGLRGPMGSGKTTLTAALCRRLGAKQQANSPTFTLIQVYDAPGGEVWHADAWRLRHPDEALDIGLVEWMERPVWGFVEWVEKVADWFPEGRPIIEIEALDSDRRKLRIKPYI